MTRRLCAAILLLEAIALALSAPVLISVAGVGRATGLWTGLGLGAACLVTSGLLRFRWAYLIGWAIQAVAIALGFVVGAMFAVGVIFGGLWATAYWLGRKIERERAAWEAADGAPGAAEPDEGGRGADPSAVP